MTDLELLKKYEPVLRFTKGEVYFPTDIEGYIAKCSLWVSHSDKSEEKILSEGKVTLKTLLAKRDLKQGDVLYLRFVDLPSIENITQRILKEGRLDMRGKKRGWKPGRSRLARVGYVSRIIDALFSLTLLARGKVPGAVAAIAEEKSRKINKRGQNYSYYGRVFRDSGWIGLQYWFFYHYDDWRTSFEGVNDHEADWEMISIYLYEEKKKIIPKWVVFACHDFIGDDLRRRWDDTEQLEKVGTHPVAYIGAGSHAAYYQPGEYLIESELPYLTKALPILNKIKYFWQTSVRRNLGNVQISEKNLTIPFVEYARGNGISIGANQEKKWNPVLLSPAPDWLTKYRGLWGLFTRDPIGGEDAPAGPMYNRDGTPRFSWYDPLGFSGLDKVPTPPLEKKYLEDEIKKLKKKQAFLSKTVKAKTIQLQKLGASRKPLASSPILAKELRKLDLEIKILLAEINPLRRELSQDQIVLEEATLRLKKLKKGIEDDPRLHINTLQKPTASSQMRFDRLTEIWSAVSIGLLLVGFMLILIFLPAYTISAVVILIIAFLLTESVFRGKFSESVRTIAIFLALVSIAIIIYSFFWSIVIGLLLIGGVYLIYNNVREALG